MPAKQITNIAVFLFCVVTTTSSGSAIETWTDNTGNFSIEADYAGVKGKNLLLEKPDGTTIEVPIRRLSVKSWALAKRLHAGTKPAPAKSASAQLPIPPTVSPLAPFPENANLDKTVSFIREQILAGHPEVLWHALPADLRDSVDNQAFRTDTAVPLKSNAAVIKSARDLLRQIATILVKQKKHVLDSKLLASSVPPATAPLIRQLYDAGVGLVYESGMLVLSLDELDSQTATDLLDTHGPRIGGHFKELLKTVPPPVIEEAGYVGMFLTKPDAFKIQQTDEDTGNITVSTTMPAFGGTDSTATLTIEMVRYMDRWLPKDLAEQWQENRDSLSQNATASIQTLSKEPQTQQAVAFATQTIATISTALKPLELAEDQQSFDTELSKASGFLGQPTDFMQLFFGGGDEDSGRNDNMEVTEFDAPGEMNFGGQPSSFFSDEAPMTAVSLEEFNSAWKLSVSRTPRPAGEWLKELAESLNLVFSADDSFSDALATSIALDPEIQTVLGAIEQLCHSIDCQPIYAVGKLGLKRGKRVIPATATGPFVVVPTSFFTSPENGTGRMSLHIYASGLKPDVANQVNDTLATQIESATAANGTSLLRQSDFSQNGSFMMQSDSQSDQPLSIKYVEFKNLLRGVEFIQEIKGVINLELTTGISTITFDQPKNGDTQTVDGISVSITKAEKNAFRFEVTTPKQEQPKTGSQPGRLPNKFPEIELSATNAEGEAITCNRMGSFGSGDRTTIEARTKAPPSTITLKVAGKTERLAFPIQMRDISIPNWNKMPEKLLELKFDGEQPVTLEFKGIGGSAQFRNILVSATNHSNKAVSSVELAYQYLNDTPQPPSENRFGPAGRGPTPQTKRCQLSAGETKVIEIPAFFMPEGTTKASLDLKSVGFADATTWSD